MSRPIHTALYQNTALAGFLAITFVVFGAAGAPLVAQEASLDRGAQILANLEHAFPQLENREVVIGPIEPSPYTGLDQGAFTVDGAQTQRFFVASDNSKLFLLGGEPIDVSRTSEEIAAEVAKETAARQQEIAASIEGRPFRGGADAPVTIVEFSDFQCPFCLRGAQTVEEILEKYGDEVKFVFQHFPLAMHPWAKPAAIASHCAAVQSADAFWTLHDAYFRDQKDVSVDNLMAKSKEYLEGSGIDMDAWSTCAGDTESEAYQAAAAAVAADLALGEKYGVNGTPGFFVNGKLLSGALPLSAFEPLIEEARAAAPASK